MSTPRGEASARRWRHSRPGIGGTDLAITATIDKLTESSGDARPPDLPNVQGPSRPLLSFAHHLADQCLEMASIALTGRYLNQENADYIGALHQAAAGSGAGATSRSASSSGT